MTVPGIGIWLGSESAGRSPAWLEARFRLRYGADLLAFCIGSDVAVGALSAVTEIPNRAGTALALGTAVYRGNVSINGRAAWQADAATVGHLRATLAADIKSTWTVLTSPALPFSTGFACAVGTYASDYGAHCQFVTGSSGSSVLFTDGCAVKIDGIVSTNVTAGTHVYESTDGSAASPILRVGYIAGSSWTWRAPQGIVVGLSRASTTVESADSLHDLQRFFRL
jgi:hypothetical protein